MKKTLLLLLLGIYININAQTPITATIPFQGYGETQAFLGEAEYQIFLDNTTGIFDKPIILIDGFDANDSRGIPAIYDLMTYDSNNLADTLRDEGFDVVILNFPVYTNSNDDLIDGGVDFIQRNAFILIELINQINAQKVGDEELVVIGPSMGGLISRYALRYMEQNSLDHETRLYISWDSPHLGANFSIGMQYFFNYIAIQLGEAQLEALVESVINSPTSKQMLIDHYLGHLQAGSDFLQDPSLLLPTGAPNYRDAFQNELVAMGFPQQVRNISVANGSGTGIEIGSPGTNVIMNTFDVAANTTAEVEINFTPEAGQSIEVTSMITRLFGFEIASYTAISQSPPNNDGLDSAPGGKYDLDAFADIVTGNALLEEFFNNLNQSNFSYIPTISSLAITNEDDFHNSPDIDGIHDSPFDAWYIPEDNENHVTLTQENVDFVLPEIRNEVIGVNDNFFTSKYILVENPVSENIKIQLNNSYNYTNVNISIVNITGQKLMQNNYNSVLNEINIPINLNKGVYFLTINDNETSLSKKFIVK